ncbi:MAG: alpha/beta fold hydrolase [Actinomycetota bacterium]
MQEIWLTARGRALHCLLAESERDAPTVVFVHGLCGHASLFEPFVAALSDEGLNVLALDLQGHGRSEGRRGHVPFEQALANIGEVVGYASQRSGRAVGLCGSGLGGILSFYAAMPDDRVAAVACHTAADLRALLGFERRKRQRALAWLVGKTARRAEHVAPLARLPVRVLFPLVDFFEDEARLTEWRADADSTWWYTLETLTSTFVTPDDKPAVEAMTKPLFVVAGEEDRVVPLAAQEDLCALVPDAELSVLGGAGHMIPLEHTAETAARAGGWLRKVL